MILAHDILHELIHAKSRHYARKNKSLQFDYKAGFRLTDLERYDSEYFKNFEEGITEELVKKYFYEMVIKEEIFEKELASTRSFKDRQGAPCQEDLYLALGEDYFLNDDERRSFARFCYQKQRENLHILITKIYLKNQNRFGKREEVFDIFAGCKLRSDLIKPGLLIDRTFGKGTFRTLGEVDSDLTLQRKFIYSL
ncbi:MAG: hypothetical protein GF347_02440 [Candidatus Moranbacteria bacterium]|nr:hypothetical protein [Candidatus Moranbacteria bacterium]